MLDDAAVVCLGSIDWAFNRQIPQELASGLAARGNRVLYVENTGVRRAGLRDAGRLWARLKSSLRARGRAARVGEALDVLAPLLLPFPYWRAALALNRRLLLRALRRWRRANPDGPLVVITFLPTPLAREVIHGLEADLVVYYCVDRLAASSPGARALLHSEPALLAEADLVVATSASLEASAARHAARVELLASGVRAKKFEQARRAGAVPPPLAGLRGPVIGFVGSLRGATDIALLTEAAELAPDLEFVLVGPVHTDVRRLAARPNVRMVGAVAHREVMDYMARFDAGVLPYVLDEFTAAVMPVKLKEYLAAGLPVVSTLLPEVLRFAAEHPGMVTFADDAARFVAALRAALGHRGAAEAERRMSVARRYDWSVQIATLGGWMEELLEESSRPQTARARRLA